MSTPVTTGRWGPAALAGVLVGLALSLSLSPQLRTWALVIGILAALAVALFVVRRRPEVLDK